MIQNHEEEIGLVWAFAISKYNTSDISLSIRSHFLILPRTVQQTMSQWEQFSLISPQVLFFSLSFSSFLLMDIHLIPIKLFSSFPLGNTKTLKERIGLVDNKEITQLNLITIFFNF